MTARGSLDRALRGPLRAARATGLAVLLVCLPALAGCGSDEEPRVQRVAYCQSPSSDIVDDGFLEVQFRQWDTVVATGSVSVGTVFTAEVPLGGVQVYVDDVHVGTLNEGVPTDGPYHSPAPDEVIYLHGGEGCPATVPPGPDEQPAG